MATEVRELGLERCSPAANQAQHLRQKSTELSKLIWQARRHVLVSATGRAGDPLVLGALRERLVLVHEGGVGALREHAGAQLATGLLCAAAHSWLGLHGDVAREAGRSA